MLEPPFLTYLGTTAGAHGNNYKAPQQQLRWQALRTSFKILFRRLVILQILRTSFKIYFFDRKRSNITEKREIQEKTKKEKGRIRDPPKKKQLKQKKPPLKAPRQG